MNHNVPVHDFSICEENKTLLEIFVYNPLTVMTPILAQNFELHRHKFYELMYLTGGKGNHIIDFETYEHRSPVLYFLSPRQIHFWDLSERIEGYVFLFKEDFFVSSRFAGGSHEISFFQDMLDSPAFLLNPTHQARLEPLIEAMVHETKRKEIAQRSALQAYFHIFLVTIQRPRRLQRIRVRYWE